MKIKRYMAPSMRAALAQVRNEQGAEAVILSSRRVDEGIEVIAAVDYDEALIADAARPRSAAGAAPIVAAPIVAAPIVAAPIVAAPAEEAAPLAVAPPPDEPVAGSTDHAYLALRREFKDLRDLLEVRLADGPWQRRGYGHASEPLQARVLEELAAMDVAPDVALSLATHLLPGTKPENSSHIPMALLMKHLPMVDDLRALHAGIVAVVGPTGVGKTTTIAKLAARWSMKHGSQDLALVSTDGYRIGAREQLMTYARILGAPMHVANSGEELSRVLDRLQSHKMILIDTAGMGPRDTRLSEQLSALRLGAARARVLLALPAQGEAHALEEIIQAFAGAAPMACILTKVDEAATLGGVLSITLRHRLKIAYLCDGQRVPEDLHAAHQRRVWLVRAAFQLKENAAPRGADDGFERESGRASANA